MGPAISITPMLHVNKHFWLADQLRVVDKSQAYQFMVASLVAFLIS
jgi:hypothetical protein